MDKYTYTVAWSAEDDAYVARVAEFPLLAAHADSTEEALAEIKSVVEMTISDLVESGEPVPEPFGKRSYSGRLNVRMPPALHRTLAIEATRQGVSLNQLINAKLASH